MSYQGSVAQLKQVEALVLDRTTYRFLGDNFDGPQMDKDQMLWLHEAISGTELDDIVAHQVIGATLYVVLAHDTHERIDEPNDQKQHTLKERQLTVLAGDFYSSLYYRTLSEFGMIDLLAALQRGVQETNEAKVNLYQLHITGDEDYLTHLVTSKAAIFAKFATYFGKDEAFVNVGSHMILLTYLLRERTQWLKTDESLFKKAYEHGYMAMNAQANFAVWLDDLIVTVKAEIKANMGGVAISEMAEKRLQELLGQ
ncbi:heptaprenyl diphosphate synthase component 1 [Listeria weihenstephanensis]|uniref:Heptaprenyl diphosphate synthase component 1 n=1 Tax=Listeria weihenstephanensis TaxID=1006155 RepID=A0A841Z2P3_9LIST|nr:heptaprenyl diphosphate synthase component 1 [Listeria weihenstephanensis]MBC1499468.1 heptaprenyl diphosphate synthase component 1 [Listeria weihenstephanensis]